MGPRLVPRLGVGEALHAIGPRAVYNREKQVLGVPVSFSGGMLCDFERFSAVFC